MMDGTEGAMPKSIRNRRPSHNHRQRYTTRYGESVDVVSSTCRVT